MKNNIYMVKEMKSIRLKKNEEENLRKKSIEINKILINSNRKPLTESELLHEIIEEGLKRIEAGVENNTTMS